MPIERRESQQLLGPDQLLACSQLEVPNHRLSFYSQQGNLEEMEKAAKDGAINWEEQPAMANCKQLSGYYPS